MQKMRYKTDPEYDIKMECALICLDIVLKLIYGDKQKKLEAVGALADIVLSYMRLKNAAGN